MPEKCRLAETFDWHHGLCCCVVVADEIALRNVANDAFALLICCGCKRNTHCFDSARKTTLVSDVAVKFGLTRDNNPKHPSFYTTEWAESDFERGEIYFIAYHDGEPVGCVAYESPNDELSYLNRLSVLPEYRRNGLGEKLVQQVIEYSRKQGKRAVSIGIIAKFDELRRWYMKLGFMEGETMSFPHLPFEVLYLRYPITNQGGSE